MLIYHIRAGAFTTPKGIDVRVVAIHQDSRMNILECSWEELAGPEHAILRSRPCHPRVAIQAMDQDYVDFRVGVVVDLGHFKAVYFGGVDCGSLLTS